MHHECVIIGGGVAGLAAAIRLTELGWKPILIEVGKYPSHKVCGEFISPESVDILKQWGIDLIPVTTLRWHIKNNKIEYSFPTAAGSLSHWHLDPLLLQKALNGGASRIQAKVSRLAFDGNVHQIELENRERVTASHLILATGRLPGIESKIPKILYQGIKAHFSGIPVTDSIEMFSFPGAYVGMSPIEDNRCNIACIALLSEVERLGPPALFMQHLMTQNEQFGKYLRQGTMLFENWMTASIPQFGIKSFSDWPSTYRIGDAAGTIPPATGSGLSMAIGSGILAAEYVNSNDPIGFKKAWLKRYRSPILWGKALHKAMLQSICGNLLIKCGKIYPSLVKHIYKNTRTTKSTLN